MLQVYKCPTILENRENINFQDCSKSYYTVGKMNEKK